jgi:hypothetical protein
MAAKQAAWVGTFVAVAPIVIIAVVIEFQEYKGCRIK